MALQPQVVGAPRRYRNAHPRAVHMLDGFDPRAGRHQVRRLNLAVGGREIDGFRPLGLGPDVGDIPDAGPGIVGNLSRRLVRQELEPDAELTGQLPGHVRRHAIRFAAGRLAGYQQEVGHVDGGSQRSTRGKVAHDLGGGIGMPARLGHWEHPCGRSGFRHAEVMAPTSGRGATTITIPAPSTSGRHAGSWPGQERGAGTASVSRTKRSRAGCLPGHGSRSTSSPPGPPAGRRGRG